MAKNDTIELAFYRVELVEYLVRYVYVPASVFDNEDAGRFVFLWTEFEGLHRSWLLGITTTAEAE